MHPTGQNDIKSVSIRMMNILLLCFIGVFVLYFNAMDYIIYFDCEFIIICLWMCKFICLSHSPLSAWTREDVVGSVLLHRLL